MNIRNCILIGLFIGPILGFSQNLQIPILTQKLFLPPSSLQIPTVFKTGRNLSPTLWKTQFPATPGDLALLYAFHSNSKLFLSPKQRGALEEFLPPSLKENIQKFFPSSSQPRSNEDTNEITLSELLAFNFSDLSPANTQTLFVLLTCVQNLLLRNVALDAEAASQLQAFFDSLGPYLQRLQTKEPLDELFPESSDFSNRKVQGDFLLRLISQVKTLFENSIVLRSSTIPFHSKASWANYLAQVLGRPHDLQWERRFFPYSFGDFVFVFFGNQRLEQGPVNQLFIDLVQRFQPNDQLDVFFSPSFERLLPNFLSHIKRHPRFYDFFPTLWKEKDPKVWLTHLNRELGKHKRRMVVFLISQNPLNYEFFLRFRNIRWVLLVPNSEKLQTVKSLKSWASEGKPIFVIEDLPSHP